MSIQALKLQVVVPESRELHLQLPENVPTGLAEVLILSEKTPEAFGNAALFALIEEMNGEGEDQASLDERLRQERNAWE